MFAPVLRCSALLVAFASIEHQAAPSQVAAPATGPQLTFAAAKYDFGPIPAGAVVSHTFEFQNTGTKPLVIATIGTSCGCTTPDWSKKPIAPGHSGQVSVRFSTAGRSGRQHKLLTVESNAGAPVVLAIVGQVDPVPTR